MAKRFIVAFFTFIGLIFPAAFALALLAAPARPAPLERPGCDRTLADTTARAASLQAPIKHFGAAHGAEVCAATRLYFLEVVKARAVTALCRRAIGSSAGSMPMSKRSTTPSPRVAAELGNRVTKFEQRASHLRQSSMRHAQPMLNRLTPNIVRQKYRLGTGGVFGMRQGAIVCAVWITAASACAFPAAAQDASAPADAAAASADAVANPPADVPLPPEESAALGSALTVDAADLAGSQPVKPLRLPSLNDPNKFDVSHNDKPDGSSTLTVKQPLASEWDAKVGADLSLAAAPPDGATPSKPFPLKPAGRHSGAAWASVGVADLATVDARVDPGSDQGKLGTTFKRSIPVGGKFSVTLQDSYSMTETSALPPRHRPTCR